MHACACVRVPSEQLLLLRTVFESGREREFVEKLADFATKKQHDIEDICNYHYRVRAVLHRADLRRSAL